MKLRPLRILVMWLGFPMALQFAALAVVVWLAVNGFGIGNGVKAEELMTLRKTNLTTLVVWGLWWPGMIAIVLAFGRAWCTVCPMELVNRLGDAIAGKVGWPRARLGKLLRAGWMTILFYLILQFLVAGVSLHRVPHFTAVLLLALMVMALLSGLTFREPRSFCKAFCPSAALLSVYGRYTPIQLEARDPSVCDSCSTKDCVLAENRDRFDKRSCPSLLRPYRRKPSDGCVLCLQCAKVCPHGNMGFGYVAPSAPIRRNVLLQPFEAVFVMVALGFVAHEVIGEVKWLDALFHVVPTRLNALLPSLSFGWFEALWFLLLFPLIVWGGIAGVAYIVGHRAGIRSSLLAAATGAAPVVAVAHLAKATAKVTSWGGFLPLSLQDPQGLDTYRRIAGHSLHAPGSLLDLSVVGWIMLALTVVIAWRAIRWVRDMPTESLAAARVGLATSATLFAAVLCVWVWPVP